MDNNVTVFDHKRTLKVEMYEKYNYETGPKGNAFMIIINTDRKNDRKIVLEGEEANKFLTMLENYFEN